MSTVSYNELQALYLGLFDRPADAGGETYWYNQSQAGTDVFNSLSPYAQYYSADNGLNGTAVTSSNITGEIQNIYTNLLGYTPSATDAGVAYWASQFNSGVSIGHILDAIYNIIESLPANSPYIDEQTTLNSRISAANSFTAANAFNTYSNTTYLAEGQSIFTNQITSTFVLTPGADIATATNFIGSLTPFLTDGVGPTLNYDDILTGTSGGTNNTLTINDDYAKGTDVLPLGVQISNIQNIKLQTNGNAGIGIGTPFNTTNIAGVVNLTATSAGGGSDYVQAALTTNITVNHGSTLGGVTSLGGDGVTITENSSGQVWVGLPDAIQVPIPADVPTGAVSVTVNGTGAGSIPHSPTSINIVGGSSVTVDVTNANNTQTIDVGNTPNNTGDSVNGGLANTSGAIIITDAGGYNNGSPIAIVSFGGSTVNVTTAGGLVQVGEYAASPTAAFNEPTGVVKVNDMQTTAYNGGLNGASPGGPVSVYGGTDVAVTTNTGGAVLIGGGPSVSNPSGNVTVTDTSTNASGAYNLGAGGFIAGGYSSFTIINGGVNILVNETGRPVTIGGSPTINPTGTVQVNENAISQQKVSIDGGNGVTVNAQGQTVNIGTLAGTAGAQIVNQSAVLTGAGLGYISNGDSLAGTVTIDGGTSVTVNTTGGGVNVGSATVGSLTPTGAVQITDTFSGANTGSNFVIGLSGEAFNVYGGTTVNITTTPTASPINIGANPYGNLNVAGTALTNIASDPTGNVTIINSETNSGVTAYGTGLFDIYTDGAASVSVTGGDVNLRGGPDIIADVNSYLATGGANAGLPVGASHLASVLLDGVAGAVTIHSDAFNTLTIADSLKGSTATTVTNAGGGGYDTEGAHTLALTLNNDTNTGTKVTDGSATAITVATGASAAADNIIIDTAKATSFTFNNTAAVTVQGATMSGTGTETVKVTGSGNLILGDTTGWNAGNLASIDAHTASGAITDHINISPFLGGWVSPVVVNSPVNVTAINGLVTAFSGGSGNDVILVEDGASKPIDGGGGSNEVILNNTAATYNGLVSPTQPVINHFTNFQTLGLTNGASGAFDVSGFTGVDLLANWSPVSPVPLTLNNAAAGETLTIQGVQPYPVTWSPVAGATTLPITIGIDGSGGTVGMGSSPGSPAVIVDTKAGMTTWAIDSVGAGTGTNYLELNDNGAKVTTITVAGDEKMTLTANGDALSAISSITVTSSANTDVSGVVLAAGGATITGGAGMLTANMDNMNGPTSPIDKVVSGTGGVTVTLGAGAAGNGSENVNLSAAAAASTLIAPTSPVAGDGTRGVVQGFHITANPATSDVLDFQTASPTVYANTNSVSGTSTSTYSVANGVFTLVTAAGAVAVPATAAAAELSDIQTLINAAGVNHIGAVTINGYTYVVDDQVATTAGDTIIQLNGISGIQGFGVATQDGVSTAAGNTILVGSGLTLDSAGHTGSNVQNTTYNDMGYALDTLSSSAANITNTYNNLAPWAELNINLSPGAGNVVVSQTGAFGTDTLVVNAQSTFILDSLTINGDNAIVLNANNAPGGQDTINLLVDATNTTQIISITGQHEVGIYAITDTALTTIDATQSTGNITLGATTALSQAGLTILGGTGPFGFASNQDVTASGAHDTLTAQDGDSYIVANGAGDTIFAGAGTNNITANGAGDIITIGSYANNSPNNNNQTIHASGAGDTITFSATGDYGSPINSAAMFFGGISTVDGGSSTIGIGNNDTVTFGNNFVGGGSQTVVLTGDLTHATASGNYDFTTLNINDNATLATPAYLTGEIINPLFLAGDTIVFNNVGTETLLGQVNVSTTLAPTLAAALNIAASEAAISYGTTNGTANNDMLPGHTGVIDWFQYGGNTYIVEAINATGSYAAHTALTATDEVVKIVGLADIGANGLFNGHALTLFPQNLD